MAKSSVIPEIAIGGKIEEKNAKWGGFNNAIQDSRQLPLGVSPSQQNWITSRLQDNIQLRRGQALLGQTRRTGGHASGLGVGYLGSTAIAYYSANNSLYYYNAGAQDTQEVGTNLLAGANGEDVWFASYQNLAGFFEYFGSAHTSIFKIPLANPTSVVNQNGITGGYSFASAQIDQLRLLGVQKYDTFYPPDLANAYISKGDSLSPFNLPGNAQTDQTIATGDGVTKSFSGTLSSSIVDGTFFYVVAAGAITAGTSVSAATEAGGLITLTSAGHGITQVGSFVMVLGATDSFTPTDLNGNIAIVTSIPDVNSVIVNPFGPISGGSYASGGTLYPVERFQDNGQGVLTSNQGGTGTINYATGAITLNFITAPANGVAIIGNSYSESADIMNFVPDGTSTDPPGPGYIVPQTTGGTAMASSGFQGVEYIFHNFRTWTVGLPNSASQTYGDLTNNEYWSHIGIPYPRAQFATGSGVLCLDNTNPVVPKYSILQIPAGSTNLTVVPTWISQDLDLSFFNHSTAVVFQWGDYNILACQALVNGIPQGYNTVFFVQDTESGVWNKLDYSVTSLADFAGALLSGDSLSPNAFTLFSGTDDDANIIDNFWNSSMTDLGLQGQKKVGYFYIQGLIQRPQSFNVSYALDGGQFIVPTNGLILGTGSYVNSSAPVGVGANTLGTQGIGAGTITALPFEIQFPVMTDYFEYIQIQFQALGIGWCQINKFGFRQVSQKSLKAPVYNTVQP